MERDRYDAVGPEAKAIDLRASMTPGVSMDELSRDKRRGRTLPFAIISSSGQDEDYPASELNKGIQGRGWQSSRFCFYPQELILELQWPSRIINMQLLCHEFKIPSKVEVFVSLTTPWVHNEKETSHMKRLGYLSLDPNDRSGHQARELKSIHVDSPAAVVRLVLHSCYNNKFNAYNQVGLVALIITGEPLDDHQLLQVKQRGLSPIHHNSGMQVSCGKVVDANLTAVDSFTATRIHRLQQEKAIAVQAEDYDEAKRLKMLIEKLNGLGEQIKKLELQKRAAVEVEDYDGAKSCKLEIERLRQSDGFGHENMNSLSENSDRTSKTSQFSTYQSTSDQSCNNEALSEGNTRNAMYHSIVSEDWTQNSDDKRRDFMERAQVPPTHSNSPTGIASEPERVHGDFPGASTSTSQVGEKRSGIISTVFPWWKGKETLRNSDEDGKTVALRPPVDQYSNPAQSSQDGSSSQPPQYENAAPHLPQSAVYFHSPHFPTSIQPPQHANSSQPLQYENSAHPPQPPNSTQPVQYLSSAQHAEYSTSAHPSQHSNSSQPPHHANTTQPAQDSISAPFSEYSNSVHPPQYTQPPQYSTAQPPLYSSNAVIEPERKMVVASSVSYALPPLPEQNGSHTASENDQAPEPLTDALKMEVGPLLTVLDQYQVECLCSKQWQLREKALRYVVKMMQMKGVSGDSTDNFRIMDVVVTRALNDRVPGIYYQSLQLIREYITRYAGEVPPRELQHGATGVVNILLEKLGESNGRIREAASETLIFIASKKEVGLQVVANPLLKSPKNQASWRPVLGRLQWLLLAIPIFGIQPHNRVGFASETLMSFVSQAFNSPNGEVRSTAVKVTTEVYKLMGATVERYLKGIKPVIREVLVNNFEKVTLDTRSLQDLEPLTYEELDNMPIMRGSNRSLSYYDTQKDTVHDADPRPTEAVKKPRDMGLHSMVVDQSSVQDDQSMYSTQATAPIVNFSPVLSSFTDLGSS